MRARVLIRPKAGILDPQGQTVERALPALGFDGVTNVHVGRLVELDVEDPSRLPEMCEALLANPLIEDYEIESPAGHPATQSEPNSRHPGDRDRSAPGVGQ
ncbi:MAG TPA: phosphoribosylformylglycinamidine synthase subunit PurS [Solirubrobacteraceae bacterium]